MALTLTSTAFKHNEMIPKEYTCDGQGKSPALSWTQIPDGTQSFVIICDDPDAPNGTWDHWVLFNIPATITSLEENIKLYPVEFKQGVNSWGKLGYGAPCPPSGTHRYYFKLYALDTKLNLSEGITSQKLKEHMKGHVLSETALMGRYQRSNN